MVSAARACYAAGMPRAEILAFMQRQKLAVQASVTAEGRPQAAVVGVVTSDDLQVFFDTLEDTRKCQNLRRDPEIALVLGWDLDEGCTVQLEGVADEPEHEELAAWKARYFAVFPDGVARQSWPGITYFRVRPRWIRLSDFHGPTPRIVELGPHELRFRP